MWGLVKATDGVSLPSHIVEMQLTPGYNVRLGLTLPWNYETLQSVFLNISDANATRCKFQHFFSVCCPAYAYDLHLNLDF